MKSSRDDPDVDRSPLKHRSYQFAIRIVKLSQRLQREQKEFVLSRQILRSGTSIGALIREAEFAQSRADFANKMSIALKEANETDYWLCLLRDTDLMTQKQLERLHSECSQLIAMLVTITRAGLAPIYRREPSYVGT